VVDPKRTELVSVSVSVSACLIVRDEERSLPACLAALAGLVDEVVVHDTGSGDRTVALAREAGAVVIEGTWADDFAAARNVALARCTGAWILHVDADEIVECDAAKLRAWLATQPGADTALVDIENLMDDGTGHSYGHRAVRLFRRERAHWAGRIHEQVVAGPGQPPLRPAAEAAPLRIVHHGYLSTAMAEKDKVTRNLRLVEAALANGERSPELLLDLGRSLKAAGRLEEAAAALAESSTPAALEFLASCQLGLGRLEEAAATIARLRGPMAQFLQGQLLLQANQPTQALQRFEAIDELVDQHGRRRGSALLAVHRATALGALQRWPEAADQWAEAVGNQGGVSGNISALIEAFTKAARSQSDLTAVLLRQVDAVLAELPNLPVPEAELVARVLWQSAGPDPRLENAIKAAAVVAPPDQFTDALLRLDASAPAAIPIFIEAAISTADRGRAMAASLDQLGATDVAATVREYAETFPGKTPQPAAARAD